MVKVTIHWRVCAAAQKRQKRVKKSCHYIDASCVPGVRAGTRALIKHGEITALEDSKATPQKVVYQYMAKNQN